MAQESLAAVQELLDETRKQQEAAGILSRLDVVTAESQVAASQRDLIVAQTNLQQQETTLKQLISKTRRSGPGRRHHRGYRSVAGAARNRPAGVERALATAHGQPAGTEGSGEQSCRIRTSPSDTRKNNMLPSLAVFGLYAGSGLQGNTTTPDQRACAAERLVRWARPSAQPIRKPPPA